MVTEIGLAKDTAAQIANRLSEHGLHLIFLDPFNLEDLPFSVIQTFAAFKYVDMLIHVSAQDLQRNLGRYSASAYKPSGLFLLRVGETAVDLKSGQDRDEERHTLNIGYLRSKRLDFLSGRFELIAGSKNQRLVLVGAYQSAPARRQSFWDKIRNISGQGELL